MFNTKRNKSPKPPQRNTALGIAANTALGPLGFQAQLGPEDETPRPSRILFQSQSSVDPGLFSQEPITPVLISGRDTENKNEPTEEHIDDAREEAEPAVMALREEDYKDKVFSVPATPVGETARGFGPLRAALKAISPTPAAPKEIAAVRNRIENLLHYVTALDERFAITPDGVEEQRSREELIGKLSGIGGRLRSLRGDQGPQRSADDPRGNEDVFGVLEDLREAIFDYQSVHRMIIQEEESSEMDPGEASILNNFCCAQKAEYRHGGRKGCLRGTRSAILDEIELWTREPSKPSVYWLNGLAGTGKSAIAQTIAERLCADGRLGASFFCSRDFEDRRDLQLIFPTLAVQLAQRYRGFRSNFVPLVRADPKIAYESLYNQMNKLIVRPLLKSAVSTVIVIDALDECKDEEPASAILSVLGQFVSQIPKVKFFLTGRPERRILEGFRLPLLARVTDVFVLHGVEPSQIDGDIRLFFKHKLSELAVHRRGQDEWPNEEQVDLLCGRARGLFVYAVATVRFVDYKNKNPKKQLNRLLETPESTTIEGQTKFNAEKSLDSLYASILQEAFTGDSKEDDPMIRSLLGAIVLAANPLSPSAIAALLGFDTEDILPLLLSAHSLLLLNDEDSHHPIRPFHKSFPDFIVDPGRCADPRFLVHPPDHHAKLLLGCLEILNRKLERNMCQLPDAVINSEVDDLDERTERYLDEALQYACKFWHKHLPETSPAHRSDITPALGQFLEQKFLFWLEALSVLRVAREAINALEAVAKWLDISPTLDLVDDYLRFVVKFFDVIDTSAPHIYHSALLLSPRKSIIRTLHESHARPLARVVHGLSMSWESAAAVLYSEDTASAAAWSPCGRLIARTEGGPAMVEILDATTLGKVKALRASLGSTQLFDFSPDGRTLTGFNEKLELTSWDLQTGGIICTIPPETHMANPRCFSSAHSKDGKIVAVAYTASFNSTATTAISTYNLTSESRIYSYHSEERIVASIWTHGDCLRFASVGPECITIWEVDFTSIDTLVEVVTLPLPEGIRDAEEFLFLSAHSRLAFILPDAVLVWDAQKSELLLNSPREFQTGAMTFSPDGRFFAYSCGPHVRTWKESPTGYRMHQDHHSHARELLFSPGGELIIGIGLFSLELWHTKDPTPSLASFQDQHRLLGNFVLGFSLGETSAAVARYYEKVVTFVDLESGEPRLTINTDAEVLCLGVTRTTIAVVCKGKVLTWNLPGEDWTSNTRASTGDSVQTTILDSARPRSDVPLANISISPDLSRVAIIRGFFSHVDVLDIYDTPTGKCLTNTTSTKVGAVMMPWFTLDGCEVRFPGGGDGNYGCKIIESNECNSIRLEPVEPGASPPGGSPWSSARGYEVVGGEWVIGPGGKRLLWLPHSWRSVNEFRTWRGRFLGLSHWALPEAVILEFYE